MLPAVVRLTRFGSGLEEARVITCSKCSKENQDHYKFCLGCGAELPRDAAPKPFAAPEKTPPHGMKVVAPATAPMAAPPAPAAPPPAPLPPSPPAAAAPPVSAAAA